MSDGFLKTVYVCRSCGDEWVLAYFGLPMPHRGIREGLLGLGPPSP